MGAFLSFIMGDIIETAMKFKGFAYVHITIKGNLLKDDANRTAYAIWILFQIISGDGDCPLLK